MKDDESHSIFNAYNKHQTRLAKINYLREGFEEGVNPFAGDSNAPGGGNKDSDDKNDDKSEKDSESKETNDDENKGSNDDKSTSSSSKSSKSSEPSSKPSTPKKKDGKLTEEELDEELDLLAAKKDKIQKLFDSESIDKEVAHNALGKIKVMTNQLVEKYI